MKSKITVIFNLNNRCWCKCIDVGCVWGVICHNQVEEVEEWQEHKFFLLPRKKLEILFAENRNIATFALLLAKGVNLFIKGEMAEWSIAAVLKTVDCNRSGGSNPSLSAGSTLK